MSADGPDWIPFAAIFGGFFLLILCGACIILCVKCFLYNRQTRDRGGAYRYNSAVPYTAPIGPGNPTPSSQYITSTPSNPQNQSPYQSSYQSPTGGYPPLKVGMGTSSGANTYATPANTYSG